MNQEPPINAEKGSSNETSFGNKQQQQQDMTNSQKGYKEENQGGRPQKRSRQPNKFNSGQGGHYNSGGGGSGNFNNNQNNPEKQKQHNPSNNNNMNSLNSSSGFSSQQIYQIQSNGQSNRQAPNNYTQISDSSSYQNRNQTRSNNNQYGEQSKQNEYQRKFQPTSVLISPKNSNSNQFIVQNGSNSEHLANTYNNNNLSNNNNRNNGHSQRNNQNAKNKKYSSNYKAVQYPRAETQTNFNQKQEYVEQKVIDLSQESHHQQQNISTMDQNSSQKKLLEVVAETSTESMISNQINTEVPFVENKQVIEVNQESAEESFQQVNMTLSTQVSGEKDLQKIDVGALIMQENDIQSVEKVMQQQVDEVREQQQEVEEEEGIVQKLNQVEELQDKQDIIENNLEIIQNKCDQQSNGEDTEEQKLEEQEEVKEDKVEINFSPECVEFADEWIIWICFSPEQQQNSYQDEKTFFDNNQVVMSFKNLQELGLILQDSRMRRISDFFTFKQVRNLSLYLIQRLQVDKDETKLRTVDAISFFKKGIKPIWEDEKNFRGQDLSTKFSGASANDIDEIYLFLLMQFVSEEFPFREQMNGFRFADKGHTKKSGVRLEIWFDEITSEESVTLKEYFTDVIHTKWSNPVLVWKSHYK